MKSTVHMQHKLLQVYYWPLKTTQLYTRRPWQPQTEPSEYRSESTYSWSQLASLSTSERWLSMQTATHTSAVVAAAFLAAVDTATARSATG